MNLTKRKIIIAFFAGAWIFFIWKLFIEKPEDEPHIHQSNTSMKTVLLWTKLFDKENYIKSIDMQYCPQRNCVFSSDKALLSQSDAVIFHLRDTDVKNLPKTRHENQRWVLLHHESPPHTPNVLKDLDGQINWTITYRLDSDIVLTPRSSRKKNPSHSPKINRLENKTSDIVWFVSNCKTPSNREGYVKKLQETIDVDVIGDCGKQDCKPKMSQECYESYTKSHRFYLSFENSVCKDYVTEKFYNVLGYNIIPIVFNGADMTKIAPNKSYINALDFKSPKELGEFLLKLSKDPELYNSYFKWKDDYEFSIVPYPCQLCMKLHSQEPVKIWHSLNEWFVDLSNCRKWPGGI